jgi:hypothetical protein
LKVVALPVIKECKPSFLRDDGCARYFKDATWKITNRNQSNNIGEKMVTRKVNEVIRLF